MILRRFAALVEASPATGQALEETIGEFNGRRGNPLSFDRLEQLLAAQVYRLCDWRVATDEINYRRFFDINALAAIRVECPEVFQAVHALIFRLLAAGWVTAMRIDHPDGLWDPKGYFENLQQGFREAIHDVADPRVKPPLYLAVEKILAHDEALDPQWPVCGTTGYDFLNLLNGLFVDRRGYYALRGIYPASPSRASRLPKSSIRASGPFSRYRCRANCSSWHGSWTGFPSSTAGPAITRNLRCGMRCAK